MSVYFIIHIIATRSMTFNCVSGPQSFGQHDSSTPHNMMRGMLNTDHSYLSNPGSFPATPLQHMHGDFGPHVKDEVESVVDSESESDASDHETEGVPGTSGKRIIVKEEKKVETEPENK